MLPLPLLAQNSVGRSRRDAAYIVGHGTGTERWQHAGCSAWRTSELKSPVRRRQTASPWRRVVEAVDHHLRLQAQCRTPCVSKTYVFDTMRCKTPCNCVDPRETAAPEKVAHANCLSALYFLKVLIDFLQTLQVITVAEL